MIKILCLSNDVLEEMKMAFGTSSPIDSVENQELYYDDCDVFLGKGALIMYVKDELTIFYKGVLFRMSVYDFSQIVIE